MTNPEVQEKGEFQTQEAEQLELEAETGARSDEELLALLEAIVYVTDEPLTASQIAAALGEPKKRVEAFLSRLVEEYSKPHHGLAVREVAGGYKMSTKPEHHEVIRAFVKKLQPRLKLSMAALETLAVIAYKQPITAPEIMEIRGVQGASVLKTLLDRKLITTAGRKNVVGRPILYKTTKEFLVQFGLKDLSELPTLKEFEELRRMALGDDSGAETGGNGKSESGPTEAKEASSSSEPAQQQSSGAESPTSAEVVGAGQSESTTEQHG